MHTPLWVARGGPQTWETWAPGKQKSPSRRSFHRGPKPSHTKSPKKTLKSGTIMHKAGALSSKIDMRLNGKPLEDELPFIDQGSIPKRPPPQRYPIREALCTGQNFCQAKSTHSCKFDYCTDDDKVRVTRTLSMSSKIDARPYIHFLSFQA